MFEYFGKSYTFNEVASHTGDISQCAGFRQYTLRGGPHQGVEVTEVKTGAGLSYAIVHDRAGDIAWAEYKGIPLAFISAAGFSHPHRFEPEGNEWLRGFGGGLLTTCGLTHVGQATEFEGVEYGLHGRISYLPAHHVSTRCYWEHDEYVLEVEFEVRQVKVFAEHLVLLRRYRSYAGRNSIEIEDRIENRGTRIQPVMLLYHMNFGFPVVNEDSLLAIRTADSDETTDPGDAFAVASDEAEADFHTFPSSPSADEKPAVLLCNDRSNPQLAVELRYSGDSLKWLHTWFNLRSREYVLSIEPANCLVEGIAKATQSGRVAHLAPQEVQRTWLHLEVVDGAEDVQSVLNALRSG